MEHTDVWTPQQFANPEVMVTLYSFLPAAMGKLSPVRVVWMAFPPLTACLRQGHPNASTFQNLEFESPRIFHPSMWESGSVLARVDELLNKEICLPCIMRLREAGGISKTPLVPTQVPKALMSGKQHIGLKFGSL